MINSIKSILDKLEYKINDEDTQLSEFFKENGYCIIPKSNFVEENIDEFKKIVDDLLKKESWRGGWEGKEEYMKYKKDFQIGAYRLGNLFNKHKLFLKLLTESNILKVTYGILKDDIKIGALDMREPKKSKGSQDLHMDWIPKKNSSDPTENIVCFIFLDDSTKENGSIRVVPKTQRMTGWINENLDDLSQHPNEITLEVNQSSIVLMNANLWHGGTTNLSGKRRRVLFLDIRRREIPQLLNQRIYLEEETQKNLSEIEKFLLGVGENDLIFEERVSTAGNAYRKQFNADTFMKNQN
tara:strand:+ start:2511 stop:3401 length:891 start_codon:yes stop_codon:yes gene_type:complete